MTDQQAYEHSMVFVFDEIVRFMNDRAEKENAKNLSLYLGDYHDLEINWNQKNVKTTVPVPAPLVKAKSDPATFAAELVRGPEPVIEPFENPWDVNPPAKPAPGTIVIGAQAGAVGVYSRGVGDTAELGTVTQHDVYGPLRLIRVPSGAGYQWLWVNPKWLAVFQRNPSMEGG